MKRVVCLLSALVLFLSGVDAQSVDLALRELVLEMTREYQLAEPDTLLRPTVSLLPFTKDDGRSDPLDAPLRSSLEQYLSRSSIFILVDRENLDASLRELELSLSGLTEGSRVGAGLILDVDYLLTGTISRTDGGYRLHVKLIDVETSRIRYAGTADLDQAATDKQAAEFKVGIFQYGFGVEVSMSMLQVYNNAMSDAEGQSIGEPIVLANFLYRPFPWLVTGLSFETNLTPIRLSKDPDSRDAGTLSIPYASIVNMDTTEWGTEGVIHYSKERSYSSFIGAMIGFVLAPLPEFNLTTGCSVFFTANQMQQYYKQVPIPFGEGTMDFFIDSTIDEMVSLEPYLKLQWFFAPRLAFNLAYQYRFQLRTIDSSKEGDFLRYWYGNRETNGTFPELWDLRPSIDPLGDPHYFDLSGHKLSFGLGMYF
jgi:TolB-like protein